MDAKPMLYALIVQCRRSEIGVIASYEASTPFPSFSRDSTITLLDCDPTVWDIGHVDYRIVEGEGGTVVCLTYLLVDSPVVTNRGFVMKKKSGETVGPSETRFGYCPQ